MKELIIALLVLPFLFSCNSGEQGLNNHSSDNNSSSSYQVKEGVIRVEIEHGNFSGDLQQETLTMRLVRWNESMKNLKIAGSYHVYETPHEIVQYIGNYKHYTIGIYAKETDLKKKLIYETSEKICNLSLSYGIDYKHEEKNRPDQDIPIKVKVYVDGELKKEESSVCKIRSNFAKISLYSIVHVSYDVSLDSFSFDADDYPSS